MGPVTGIIPGKRVLTSNGEIVAVYDEITDPAPQPLERPSLVAPTLPAEPGMNRAQRRAAKKARK